MLVLIPEQGAAGSGRRNPRPFLAVPVQGLVELGLAVAVVPHGPAVAGRGAPRREQIAEMVGAGPAGADHGDLRPLLAVPVQDLVELGLAGRGSVFADRPAVARRRAEHPAELADLTWLRHPPAARRQARRADAGDPWPEARAVVQDLRQCRRPRILVTRGPAGDR